MYINSVLLLRELTNLVFENLELLFNRNRFFGAIETALSVRYKVILFSKTLILVPSRNNLLE